MLRRAVCMPRPRPWLAATQPRDRALTTFYKRELPANCVALSSKEGKAVFREALEAGSLENFFPLAEQFRTQSEPAYCGLGSLVMALNAMGADPKRVWKGPWRWFEEETLEACSPLEVIKQQGTTMSEFSCLASCNGASVKTKYAEEHTVADLRRDVQAVVTREDASLVLVASYSRTALGQTGTGHFSPIGGFHASKDMVLIMDVARFKYPAHWVSLEALFAAMLPVDDVTGRSRGWHVLARRTAQLSLLHFQGHLPQWRDVVLRLRNSAGSPEALLHALIELAGVDVFPQLADGIQSDRWHIISRIRQLPVYGRLPATMDESKRLVVALLHEALSSDHAERHKEDRPFLLELRAIAHVVHTLEDYCSVPKCATCNHEHAPHGGHHQ